MLIGKGVSTGISRVDNDHSNSVLICKGFQAIEVNLPFTLWEKIEVSDLNSIIGSSRSIKLISWPGQ